jgi:hypothetical protein
MDRRTTGVATSPSARHVEAGIVELQRRVADQRMDLAAVDAGSVDAGLREFIPAILVALIDENVVVDPARDDVKLGRSRKARTTAPPFRSASGSSNTSTRTRAAAI